MIVTFTNICEKSSSHVLEMGVVVVLVVVAIVVVVVVVDSDD